MINPPPNVIVAAAEDAPPAGWVVSNISDSGIWDEESQKVKWGPLFAPSIPAQVTYEITPPPSVPGSPCFDGTVTFDTVTESINGNQCINGSGVPAASAWGMWVMILCAFTAATVLLRRSPVAAVRRQ